MKPPVLANLLPWQRRTESWLSSMTSIIGGILLTAMLLGFCWYAVFAASRGDSQAELNELLLAEIISDEPRLGISDSPALLTRAEPEVGKRVTHTPSP